MLCNVLPQPAQDVEQVGSVTLVHCQTLTMGDARAVREFAKRLTEGAPSCLLLDFGLVDRLSSALFALLLRVQKQVRSAGGKMALYGIQPGVAGFFALTNVDRFLDIYDNERQALASCTASRFKEVNL
jgi:anti-anti-sigma factor